MISLKSRTTWTVPIFKLCHNILTKTRVTIYPPYNVEKYSTFLLLLPFGSLCSSLTYKTRLLLLFFNCYYYFRLGKHAIIVLFSIALWALNGCNHICTRTVLLFCARSNFHNGWNGKQTPRSDCFHTTQFFCLLLITSPH